MKATSHVLSALAIWIVSALALNTSFTANSAEPPPKPAAPGSGNAEKNPKEVWEKLVDHYFLFAPEVVAEAFKQQVRSGDFNPFAERVYFVRKNLPKGTTLSALAKEYGEPDKKEMGVTENKVTKHRWWWGPVVFVAADENKPIEANGLDVAWLHNQINKDNSARFGEVPGGAANVAVGKYSEQLTGSNELRVTNPHQFGVTVLLRSGMKGLDLSISKGESKTVFVPDGNYNMFFIFGDRPAELYQGDSFALHGYGVEFRIGSGVTNNYRIRKVR